MLCNTGTWQNTAKRREINQLTRVPRRLLALRLLEARPSQCEIYCCIRNYDWSSHQQPHMPDEKFAPQSVLRITKYVNQFDARSRLCYFLARVKQTTVVCYGYETDNSSLLWPSLFPWSHVNSTIHTIKSRSLPQKPRTFERMTSCQCNGREPHHQPLKDL